MTIKLSTFDGEVVDFHVIHAASVGLEENKLIAPGSGQVELKTYVGVVQGSVRLLLVEEDGTSAYLVDKAPYTAEVIAILK